MKKCIYQIFLKYNLHLWHTHFNYCHSFNSLKSKLSQLTKPLFFHYKVTLSLLNNWNTISCQSNCCFVVVSGVTCNPKKSSKTEWHSPVWQVQSEACLFRDTASFKHDTALASSPCCHPSLHIAWGYCVVNITLHNRHCSHNDQFKFQFFYLVKPKKRKKENQISGLKSNQWKKFLYTSRKNSKLYKYGKKSLLYKVLVKYWSKCSCIRRKLSKHWQRFGFFGNTKRSHPINPSPQ